MKTRNSLLFASLTLFLTSCHPGTQVYVVNNTGLTVTVVSLDTELTGTPYTVAINQTVRIKVPYKLRVQRGSEIWNYDIPNVRLPEKYRKRISGNWFLEKVQIEMDGTINHLYADQRGPVDQPPEQPTGYPIRPRKSQQ